MRNRKIRDFVEHLKLQEGQNPVGIVLKELHPIRKIDAVHWVHTDACSVQGDLLKIENYTRKIQSLYDGRNAIEMQELADHLKQMMENP